MIFQKRIGTVVLLLLSVAICKAWQSDTLGDKYEMRYIAHSKDYSGEVRCTIVRRLAECNSEAKITKGVLYIHGFNDYFFQKQLGEEFNMHCYDFYALDLRKYGRSILPGQHKFEVRNLKEYFADIDSALVEMRKAGISDIILMGHSTGGLIAAYYMQLNTQAPVKALILNSPFLDWNLGKMEKFVPLVSALGAIFPNFKIKQGDSSVYGESLDGESHGEWNFNHDWKISPSPDVTAGWVRAITKAQNELKKHPYGIHIPILLMYSSSSYHGDKWSEEAQRSDAVLDVTDIKHYGCRLGIDVTPVKVNGGLHDLILSSEPVRDAVYNYIFK
ncbi:MAG: alpha/beta hydrolase, partial [Paramuribaculum sp.]|nr:alpha/beta hydrolase [Paramuribaculum sp.]